MYKIEAILETFWLNIFNDAILKNLKDIIEHDEVIKIIIKFHNFEYWSLPNKLVTNEIVLRMNG